MSYKIKLLIILLFIFIFSNATVFAFSDGSSEFFGDSFFGAPALNENIENNEKANYEEQEKIRNNNPNKSIPPVKLIRLKLKAYGCKRQQAKELKESENDDNTIESIADEEEFYENEDIKSAKKKREKNKEEKEQTQITIDCKHMDYITETGLMTATGDVLVTFPHQGTTLTADILTFDKASNKMHADGNVVITKGEQKTYGESIDIDLNEESIFIEKPLTQNPEIKIVAQEGYVQRNVITQVNGRIDVEHSSPLMMRTSGGPDARLYMRTMKVPEEEQRYITDGKSKIFKIKANEIIINSENNLDILQLKKAVITSGGKTVLKIPRLKIYTNKGHDFVEGNYPELGSRRYLGMYIGPGFVFQLPKGCLLKLIPALTYKGKIGVGGVARFWSATNETQVAYGTSKSKIVVRGEQRLDDNLKIVYSSYDYIEDWLLGRRMPKYGADIIYRKRYIGNPISKKYQTTYEHGVTAGYFQDMYEDKYFDKLAGGNIGTTRFRYMARLTQPFFSYQNDEKQFYTNLGIRFEGSAGIYGTGDTQMIGRVGPNWHIQYRRWMQDIGYLQSAYDDNTPMPVFDAYRYGRSMVYLREYLRVCPYLVLGWQGSVTLTDDTYNDKLFQECSFYASLGPQDVKLNFGFDFVRQNAFINMVLAVDPKGTTVDYDKMVIKNPENFNKLRKQNEELYKAANELPKKKDSANGILTKAVVEEIKENIDDI